ncbi:hypothetical protein Droror1_Dr00015295 [Drosera rotundifolia]
MSASGQHPHVPGEPTKTSTSIVESATSALQKFSPLKSIHQHLCAFHFYAHDMTRQVEAHHFCGHKNADMRQCLIYDGPESDARLIGIEYIVSEELFLSLPDEEKPLWHSHVYEVKSGVLYMPGVPGPVQRQDLDKLAKTYGKTIHFWQVDRGDNLPLGLPQIMMALTRKGQLYDELAIDYQRRLNINLEKESENRQYIEGPANGIHPLANGNGVGLQTVLREVDIRPVAAPAAAVVAATIVVE